MSKLVINKHFREASSITEDVFSKLQDFNEEHPQLLREGEIVISNEKNNPGLYIYTADETSVTGLSGEVIEVTSPRHTHLSSGYTKATGETVAVSSGDSVEEAIGKVEKEIDNAIGDFESEIETIKANVSDVSAQTQTALSAIVETNETFHQITEDLQNQITGESTTRAEKDDELETLIGANAEAIVDLEEATSKEAMDNFVVDNFEGGYDASERKIFLNYKLGDGPTTQAIMEVDVTEFTTQIDFLLSAYTVTVSESQDHNGQHFNANDKALILIFRVTDSGVQHDEELWFNVTEMIGEHVVMTDEQYDALSEQEKNNGFFYYTYEEDE